MTKEGELQTDREELQTEASGETLENISDILALSPECQKMLEDLKLELENLLNRLDSPDVQKIWFTDPGGEQEIGKQIIALQNEKLPEIFKDTDFESPYLSIHNIQKENNTCSLAALSNALLALGFKATEEEIVEEFKTNIKPIAGVLPEEQIKYLNAKGFNVLKLTSALEMVESLIKGGKVILCLRPPKYPISHAIVISGIKIDHGKIEFYINDSSHKNYAETASFSDVVDIIIPYSYKKIVPDFAIFKSET